MSTTRSHKLEEREGREGRDPQAYRKVGIIVDYIEQLAHNDQLAIFSLIQESSTRRDEKTSSLISQASDQYMDAIFKLPLHTGKVNIKN